MIPSIYNNTNTSISERAVSFVSIHDFSIAEIDMATVGEAESLMLEIVQSFSQEK